MSERRFADQFDDLRKGDYYSIPDERLGKIHYSKLATPAKGNIYIMKRFDNNQIAAMLSKELTDSQKYYRDNGYLILRKFIPESTIDAYLELRERLKLGQDSFKDDTSYVEHPEIL